jgi:hypothetical protein
MKDIFNKIVKRDESSKKDTVISRLIDALYTDNFNDIVENYTNTEIDFQTIVLFIKLYMMAFRLTGNKDEIKDVINYIMNDPIKRHEVIKAFNDNTIISKFNYYLKRLQ